MEFCIHPMSIVTSGLETIQSGHILVFSFFCLPSHDRQTQRLKKDFGLGQWIPCAMRLRWQGRQGWYDQAASERHHEGCPRSRTLPVWRVWPVSTERKFWGGCTRCIWPYAMYSTHLLGGKKQCAFEFWIERIRRKSNCGIHQSCRRRASCILPEKERLRHWCWSREPRTLLISHPSSLYFFYPQLRWITTYHKNVNESASNSGIGMGRVQGGDYCSLYCPRWHVGKGDGCHEGKTRLPADVRISFMMILLQLH